MVEVKVQVGVQVAVQVDPVVAPCLLFQGSSEESVLEALTSGMALHDDRSHLFHHTLETYKQTELLEHWEPSYAEQLDYNCFQRNHPQLH